MSRIRGKDTSPELAVRSLLHRLGYRFRLHRRDLPGQPDIVLPRYHAVVFVHGCYWHRHKRCKFAYLPKTRTDFWQRKFEDNVRRDNRAVGSLRKGVWHVLVIWECQVSNRVTLVRRLTQFLAKAAH